MVANVKVMRGIAVEQRQQENTALVPIELEAIPLFTSFYGWYWIDEYLFSPTAEQKLHFQKRKAWLDELFQRVKQYSQARITHLLRWFEQAPGCEKVHSFYQQLDKDIKEIFEDADKAILQIGWDSGWDGMTLWTHLLADDTLFSMTWDEFRKLGKFGQRQARLLEEARENFPTTRRVREVKPKVTASDVQRTTKELLAPVDSLNWTLLERKQID